MVTKQDFLKMEAVLWLNEKSQMLQKVGCVPYDVGKQMSLPRINLGKNRRYANDDDDDDDDDGNDSPCPHLLFNFFIFDMFSLTYGTLPAVYYYYYSNQWRI